MSDTMRERFEAWAESPDGGNMKAARVGDGYSTTLATFAWRGWRARSELPQDDEFSLLNVIHDIRQKTGIGGKPMLTEIADALAAAQAETAALVDELEKAIRHLDDSVYFWSGYAPKHIKENKGQEYEEDRAVAQSALTKVQAWRDSCK